eukprot:g29207.t1
MVRIGDVTDHDPYNLGVQQILTSLGHLETLDLRNNCLEDGLEGLRAEDSLQSRLQRLPSEAFLEAWVLQAKSVLTDFEAEDRRAPALRSQFQAAERDEPMACFGLHAARLEKPANAKAVLAKAVKSLPHSVRLWIDAANRETDLQAKGRVLRKALEFIPNSVRLWKEAVSLEERANEKKRQETETENGLARAVGVRAVECVPHSVEMWLALAKLSAYKETSPGKVLNEARKHIPTSPVIWVTAAKLEETQGNEKMVELILTRAIDSLAANGVTPDRDMWLKQAEEAEKTGFIKTCQAIIKVTIKVGVDEDVKGMKQNWIQDADAAINRNSIEVARAIYNNAVMHLKGKKGLWLRLAELETKYGNAESLDNVLQRAVTYCPHAEILWLMAAKQKWLRGDVASARRWLRVESEAIHLAAVKLESENNEIQRSRLLLARARQQCNTPKVWMQSVQLEREQGLYQQALHLSEEGLKEQESCEVERVEVSSRVVPPRSPPELAEATKFFERGLQKCPRSVPLWLCAVECEIKQQKYTKARSLLEKARLRNPGADLLWLKGVEVELLDGSERLSHHLMSKALQDPTDLTDRRGSEGSEEQIETDPLATLRSSARELRSAPPAAFYGQRPSSWSRSRGKTPRARRPAVAGWDFEAPKATETCMPRRPRSWRLREVFPTSVWGELSPAGGNCSDFRLYWSSNLELTSILADQGRQRYILVTSNASVLELFVQRIRSLTLDGQLPQGYQVVVHKDFSDISKSIAPVASAKRPREQRSLRLEGFMLRWFVDHGFDFQAVAFLPGIPTVIEKQVVCPVLQPPAPPPERQESIWDIDQPGIGRRVVNGEVFVPALMNGTGSFLHSEPLGDYDPLPIFNRIGPFFPSVDVLSLYSAGEPYQSNSLLAHVNVTADIPGRLRCLGYLDTKAPPQVPQDVFVPTDSLSLVGESDLIQYDIPATKVVTLRISQQRVAFLAPAVNFAGAAPSIFVWCAHDGSTVLYPNGSPLVVNIQARQPPSFIYKQFNTTVTSVDLTLQLEFTPIVAEFSETFPKNYYDQVDFRARPALPAGLTIDTTTGAIGGIPVLAGAFQRSLVAISLNPPRLAASYDLEIRVKDRPFRDNADVLGPSFTSASADNMLVSIQPRSTNIFQPQKAFLLVRKRTNPFTDTPEEFFCLNALRDIPFRNITEVICTLQDEVCCCASYVLLHVPVQDLRLRTADCSFLPTERYHIGGLVEGLLQTSEGVARPARLHSSYKVYATMPPQVTAQDGCGRARENCCEDPELYACLRRIVLIFGADVLYIVAWPMLLEEKALHDV